MKIISERQALTLPRPIRNNAMRKSKFRQFCSNMRVGEYAILTKSEWRGYGYSEKTAPSNLLTGGQDKFKTNKVENGWVIHRVK